MSDFPMDQDALDRHDALTHAITQLVAEHARKGLTLVEFQSTLASMLVGTCDANDIDVQYAHDLITWWQEHGSTVADPKLVTVRREDA